MKNLCLPGCLSSTQKQSKTTLEPPASWSHTFSIFSGFRCHLGRQHDTQDLAKTPQHSSEATHEPLKSSVTPPMSHAKQPSTLAQSVQDQAPKVDGVPLRASFLAPTWMHLDPLTQLLCDFFRGALAGSALWKYICLFVNI